MSYEFINYMEQLEEIEAEEKEAEKLAEQYAREFYY